MASGQGTITFDFGNAPGTNVSSIATVSAPTISATSKVELYMMGTDSNAFHNAVEHQMLPLGGLSLQVVAINAGTNFQAQAMSMLRLTKQFTVRYVWTD